ncbi:Sip1-related alpha-galactosidase [Bacillus marinisedimentorum]|uniref:Sip1-related alpha-galactosidase n=1 Tax=Bacillus marinisedimentorum TaxID=1821260 RepID=UPI0007DF5F51|nr:Sip1-related alpha-galactosidase [Bacillus marinisedimentorum]
MTYPALYSLDKHNVKNQIKVNVKLDDGKVFSLPASKITGESSGDTILHCIDDEAGILVKVKLQISARSVTGWIEAAIEQEEVFFSQKSFASVDAVTIEISEVFQPESLLAFYHFNDWWTRPVFSSSFTDLPERTQSVLWRENGLYTYLVPAVTMDCKAELSGGGTGLMMHLSPYTEGCDKLDSFVFALVSGEDPFRLVTEATDMVSGHLDVPVRKRDERNYPEVFEYLGWCSWDAFYHEVSETKLLEKMAELNRHGLPVKWVMIDDGWQDTDNKTLRSFQADERKFPEGLSAAVNRLKTEHDVNWVGVWHTLFGYWGGISPDSELASDLKKHLYKTNNGKLLPAPDGPAGFGFWNHFYETLRNAGVDFVKVDSQSAVNNFFRHHFPAGKSAYGTHTAIEAAAGNHFRHAMINCMGMASENIWYRPVSGVSRNSDDFVPGKEISFKEHALQNAYNSLFHSQFYWGDWDMFWTNHDEDVPNAVLRAVSGGPVYFSDRIGATDPDKVWPLILKDGRVLRADQPGLPTADMLFVNPNKDKVPIKVWNKLGEAAALALFNIDEEGDTCAGSFKPADIPHLESGTYALFNFFTKEAELIEFDEEKRVSLAKDKALLYTLVPFSGIAPLGLVDKYLGPLTVEILLQEENTAVFKLMEGGTFGFVSGKTPQAVYVNGMETEAAKQEGKYYEVDCSGIDTELIITIEY